MIHPIPLMMGLIRMVRTAAGSEEAEAEAERTEAEAEAESRSNRVTS